MATEERNPHAGCTTVGSPVPRPVSFLLMATAALAVVCWLPPPGWSSDMSHAKGPAGVDQRTTVAESPKPPGLDHGRIETESFAAVLADPPLMETVRRAGRTLFGDHCAACHSVEAKGGKDSPSLRTAPLLWGGDPETIAETIRVGINSDHRDTRMSQMAAFGRNGLLERGEVESVVAYVLTLSDTAASREAPAERIAAGKAIFASDCASCHGGDGKGRISVGGPDLTDGSWSHGGDPQSIFTSVWSGRKAHMPALEGRLGLVDRRILALYLVDLRSPQR